MTLEEQSHTGDAQDRDKSSEWKSCYHNGRACLEVMRRTGELLADQRRNGEEA